MVDPIEHKTYTLPGITERTFAVYQLIRDFGMTRALVNAVSWGLDEEVEILIKMGANVNATDDDEMSPSGYSQKTW